MKLSMRSLPEFKFGRKRASQSPVKSPPRAPRGRSEKSVDGERDPPSKKAAKYPHFIHCNRRDIVQRDLFSDHPFLHLLHFLVIY